jgi:hypothetical protein
MLFTRLLSTRKLALSAYPVRGGSGMATPRNRRLNAFLTDTYDHTYTRARPKHSRENGYMQWHNRDSGASSTEIITPYIEEVNTTPPPPYHSYYAINNASRRL